MQRRLAGYQTTMRELGFVPHVAESMFSVEGGEAAGREVLLHGATAIVAASDLMALGAIRAARAMGRSVPDDVSIVGYDDSALLAFTDPPLTTIRQPLTAMSKAVVAALIDRINGIGQPSHELLFRGELIVRGSTALHRTG